MAVFVQDYRNGSIHIVVAVEQHRLAGGDGAPNSVDSLETCPA